MAKQNHIYVIAFDSGTVKVGRAADGPARLATHRREARRHGVGVVAEWCSPPCGENTAEIYEARVLAFCDGKGRLRAGAEYFEGVDFEEVKRFAEHLVRQSSWSMPSAPPPAASKTKTWKETRERKRIAPTPPSDPERCRPEGYGDAGQERDRVFERVRGRLPTTEEITALDLPPGEPVLEVVHVIRAADGAAIEYGRTVYPGSRVQIARTLMIED